MHSATLDKPPYSDHRGFPYTDDQIAAIDKVRDDLVTGRLFADLAREYRAEGQARQREPVDFAVWGHVATTLARMVNRSPALAQFALDLFAAFDFYGSPADLAATIYDRAAEKVAVGFDPAIGSVKRTGCWRPYRIDELAEVTFWLAEATATTGTFPAPAISWTTIAVARAHGINPLSPSWPALVASGLIQ